MDNGTTQLTRFAYDTAGTFNLTETIDPLGRRTVLTYAANGIDVTEIKQETAPGVLTPVAQVTYNAQHRPLTYTDAAGQTTTFAYNPAGQLTSVTNPLSQTTTYQYDAQANLTAIINANGQTAASFTYDAFNRVATRTDSEGWTLAYSYDAADRVTQITYPDGTTDTYIYDKLDLASYTDRQGRQWVYTHDANRRMTKVVDPAGQQTQFGYDRAGRLTSRTDPKGFVTGWAYDIQGRLTSKTYPNNSTVTYTYEATTSRLKSITDALGKIKVFSYAPDNRLTGTSYFLPRPSPLPPIPDPATPSVSWTYDAYFPRVVSRTDGAGTTAFAYHPPGAFGALRLRAESWRYPGSPLPPAPPDGEITYAYDALGRVTTRAVSGATAEAFQYDAIGRVTGRTNDLGAFVMSYLGQTGQITSRQRTGSTVATTWSYLPNSGDRRLASIANTGHAAGQFSNFTLTTTPENFIASITETSNTAVVAPSAGTQTATFDNLNQITTLSNQAFTHDANGNLLSDGQRVYTWDAEDRLIGITYPAQPGKASAFAYDGQGRRVAMTETPAGGGSPITTRHVWCGARLCQTWNAANTLTRGYHAEGEFIPGGASLHYGIDQIGSVRRAFVSPSTAPAYGYDPYGVSLQTESPLADFGYAGMYRHGPSGLYLTWFRAYDAGTGRWLSRDPIGEGSDPAGNLYPYVEGNPVSLRDPDGLQGGLYSPMSPGMGTAFCILFPSRCRSPPENCPAPRGGLPGLPGGMANAPPAGTGSGQTGTIPVKDLDPLHSPGTIGNRPDLQKLTDKELMDSVTNPTNNDPVKIDTETGKVVDGNSRAQELINRSNDPSSTITPDTLIPYDPYSKDNSMFDW